MKKKRIVFLSLILLILSGSLNPAQAVNLDQDLRSYLIGDYETGQIMEAYNIDEQVEIASISKLMTYMVAMDHLEDLSQELMIDASVEKIGGSGLKLSQGQVYSLDELLDLSLIVSDNRATYRLATHVAGSEENFVRLMNDKAREIGLDQAVFYNSSGLPVREINDQNKMTTRELFTLSRYLLENYPEVIERTSQPYIMPKYPVDGQPLEAIENTNPLMGLVPGIDGLKTGFTNKAGHSVILSYLRPAEEEGQEDLRVIAIVMGTHGENERRQVAYDLVAPAREKYIKKQLLFKDQVASQFELRGAKTRLVDIYPSGDYQAVIDSTRPVDLEFKPRDIFTLPLRKGEVLGELVLSQDGEAFYREEVLARKKIRKAGPLRLSLRKLGDFFRNFSQI